MRKEILKALGLLTQIGISMLVPILISVFIGSLIDKFFGCSPVFLIIFIIMGVIASFRTLYMITKEYCK